MEKDVRGFTEGIQSALFYYLSMVKECRPVSIGAAYFPSLKRYRCSLRMTMASVGACLVVYKY